MSGHAVAIAVVPAIVMGGLLLIVVAWKILDVTGSTFTVPVVEAPTSVLDGRIEVWLLTSAQLIGEASG